MAALDDERGIQVEQDPNADLGFGNVVARESRQRFLNRNGSFNVRREGFRFRESISAYHYLLTISWPKFLTYATIGYLVTNALFAAVYVICGANALTGFENEGVPLRFEQAFFFSVHTLATIGYGNIAPHNRSANIVVTVEALVGLLGFAVVAGLVFARFARPTAQIRFSRKAIVAPYRGISALMFRIVNQRKNELVDVKAKVMISQRRAGGTADREFVSLKLERDRVMFFPLSWTVVHPIDESSPLFGCDAARFRGSDGEVLVLLQAFDETFSQTVHTRSSYKAEEIVWGAKFRSMFNPPGDDGVISIDIRRLDEFDRAELPS